MAFGELTALLRDPSISWSERRTLLQGWDGADAACASAAPMAQRIAPAACAIGAFAGAALGSALLLGAFAVTAAIGTVAPNHPFEDLYNRWARARGRSALPPNRAAKRLGCAIGTVFLGGAALAYAFGAATLGLALAIALGATAAFVAITGICLPSMIFTVAWGRERARAPRLAEVGRRVRSFSQ